jgi:hypothetical protein
VVVRLQRHRFQLLHLVHIPSLSAEGVLLPLVRRSEVVLEATHLFQQSHPLVEALEVLAIAYPTHLVF